MSDQLELVVEERAVSGRHVRRLRRSGIVPANVYGQNLPSMPLQLSNVALQKLMARGGNTVVVSLKVGERPPVQALIKEVQRNPRGGAITHVDFYRVAATEKLRTAVQLHFIREAAATSQGDVAVSRPLNEVMVECLPGNLPAAIDVDLSLLTQVGAVIRVGDLVVGPGVAILTDHHELVAAMHQQAAREKVDGAEAKDEAVAVATPEPPRGKAAERQ